LRSDDLIGKTNHQFAETEMWICVSSNNWSYTYTLHPEAF